MKDQVGLFFYVNGRFLFQGCELDAAECYGDCLTFSKSHFDVWEKNYRYLYNVDFDYYPRGRVVYRKTDNTFIIYYDQCIEKDIIKLKSQYTAENIVLTLDEHYQCHMCNLEYVLLW